MSPGVASSSDRSEPTLPNLVCKNASIEDVKSRLVTTTDFDEVDFKGWSGLHWALVREVPDFIACEAGSPMGSPSIWTRVVGETMMLRVNCLAPGEAELVGDRIALVLAERTGSCVK